MVPQAQGIAPAPQQGDQDERHPLTALAALGIAGGVRLSGILSPEVVRLQVFEANSADLSQAVKLASEPTALPWDRSGLSVGDARWYWLRSVSAEGNVSALIGPVTATAI